MGTTKKIKVNKRSSKRKVEIITTKPPHWTDAQWERFNSDEELFPENHFLRIHKSYLVTNNKIKQVESNKVVLNNGAVIPVGRSYKHLLNFL